MRERKELIQEVKTLELAIQDAEKRKESNPNDVEYHKQQNRRIHDWRVQIHTLDWVMNVTKGDNNAEVNDVIGKRSRCPACGHLEHKGSGCPSCFCTQPK